MGKDHRLLPAMVSLLAALFISIVLLINQINTLKSFIIILSVLIGFYIIGNIFRFLLNKFQTKEEPVIEETQIEEDELEDITTEMEDE